MTRHLQLVAVLACSLSSVTVCFAELPKVDTVSVSSIASNAYSILAAVPDNGLGESSPMLQKIIAQRRVLEQGDDPLHRQLALVLADAVAYALVREIQTAEIQRMGSAESEVQMRSPDAKSVVVQLWKANEFDVRAAIRVSPNATGDVVRFVNQNSSEDEILDGRMINKASSNILPRIWELHDNARGYRGLGRVTSADELFMYALTTAQAFRDLRIVVDLYGIGDLPQDRAVFQGVIENALSRAPVRRIDDGMKSSSLKVLSTFGRYCLPGHDAYRLKLALLLGPYMTDRSVLPKAAQRIFEEYGAPVE